MAPGERNNVGAPMFKELSEANVLYWRKYLRRCWDFSALPSDWASGALCPPLSSSLRPYLPRQLLTTRTTTHKNSLHARLPVKGGQLDMVTAWQCCGGGHTRFSRNTVNDSMASNSRLSIPYSCKTSQSFLRVIFVRFFEVDKVKNVDIFGILPRFL